MSSAPVPTKCPNCYHEYSDDNDIHEPNELEYCGVNEADTHFIYYCWICKLEFEVPLS
ncbi:MAG: hypothetical protein ACXADO_11460 [Candidatus Thorarchaeota archaeon]